MSDVLALVDGWAAEVKVAVDRGDIELARKVVSQVRDTWGQFAVIALHDRLDPAVVATVYPEG